LKDISWTGTFTEKVTLAEKVIFSVPLDRPEQGPIAKNRICKSLVNYQLSHFPMEP
jgi:hypothetical protein